MWIRQTTRHMREIWSLLKGLGITGDTFFKNTVTVHFPRQGVQNLADFRGPIALVPRSDEPQKPKCIACLMCMNICPSQCITVVKLKPTARTRLPAEGGAGKVEKPVAPKEPETYLYDYSLCSLCGLCAEICPVDSICFSSEAYLVTQDRSPLKMDLLAKLRKNFVAASRKKER